MSLRVTLSIQLLFSEAAFIRVLNLSFSSEFTINTHNKERITINTKYRRNEIPRRRDAE